MSCELTSILAGWLCVYADQPEERGPMALVGRGGEARRQLPGRQEAATTGYRGEIQGHSSDFI